MITLKNLFKRPRVQVYTDGAIRPDKGISGVAAIVCDTHGKIRHWWSQCLGPLTCNEAEYEAAIFALQNLRKIHPDQVHIFSDSQILVHQMNGLARTRASGLLRARAQLQALVVEFEQVTFQHIPRKQNRIADALANDVVDGFVKS